MKVKIKGLPEYNTYRVIINFEVIAPTLEAMSQTYPNAEINKSKITHNKVVGLYKGGRVIDAPSKDECMLFNSPHCLKLINKIPQIDGFDDSRSGLARSRKKSHTDKLKFERDIKSKPMEFEVVPDDPEKIELEKKAKDELDKKAKEELDKKAKEKLENEEKDKLEKKRRERRKRDSFSKEESSNKNKLSSKKTVGEPDER